MATSSIRICPQTFTCESLPLRNKAFSDPEKKREWIKYKLKIQGLSLAALGRKHKTSRQVVSTALYKPSPRWEHEIATALGVKPSEIWPERYDEEHEIPLRHKEAS
ncbi:helix-turn-helix domain-containing protein [Salmonella enterica]|uniref:helix-turn-helix domain-containing protein n=1 Tax=Salmonella enterica TaxID=28901 RepID=UPI00346711CF